MCSSDLCQVMRYATGLQDEHLVFLFDFRAMLPFTQALKVSTLDMFTEECGIFGTFQFVASLENTLHCWNVKRMTTDGHSSK